MGHFNYTLGGHDPWIAKTRNWWLFGKKLIMIEGGRPDAGMIQGVRVQGRLGTEGQTRSIREIA